MVRLMLILAALVFMPMSSAYAADDKDQVFRSGSAQAFEMTGTISKAENNKITVTRPGLPNANLEVVDKKTTVIINGRASAPDQLRPGMEVRASFQVAGDEIVAKEIEAGPPAQKSGAQGQQPQEQQPQGQ